MTAIAPYIEAFLREHLGHHRGASGHTCDSYAYAFKLLLDYASKKLKIAPSRLELEQIDEPLVVGFLNHLETTRANRPDKITSRAPGTDTASAATAFTALSKYACHAR